MKSLFSGVMVELPNDKRLLDNNVIELVGKSALAHVQVAICVICLDKIKGVRLVITLLC